MLSRQQIADLLGVDLADISLHSVVYGESDPPRRAMAGGTAPEHDEIVALFCLSFPPSYHRASDLLTDVAYTILMALRKTLLPRTDYLEGFASLQQRIVLHILNHQPFDIVDFILAKIEDVITDGMGVGR